MSTDELVDEFLMDKLTPKQVAEFEERMVRDIAFKNQVDLRKLIMEGIHEGYARELKEKLVQYDIRLSTKQRFSMNWKIAASVVFLVLAGIFSLNVLFKPKPGDFDFYEPGIPNQMGITSNIQFNNAMNEFKLKNYSSANKEFNRLLINNPENDTLLYYSGLCDYRNKNLIPAIEKWENIKPTSKFYDKALFRLALAFWEKEDEVRARLLLEEVLTSTENAELKNEAAKAFKALN
ncbi:MAG TPA: hypothetical protein PKC24_00705 [Cyclobacteriaceae bacterium]|nr:hypothetical protein [Cyclobacteriaceae bacterium]